MHVEANNGLVPFSFLSPKIRNHTLWHFQKQGMKGLAHPTFPTIRERDLVISAKEAKHKHKICTRASKKNTHKGKKGQGLCLLQKQKHKIDGEKICCVCKGDKTKDPMNGTDKGKKEGRGRMND